LSYTVPKTYQFNNEKIFPFTSLQIQDKINEWFIKNKLPVPTINQTNNVILSDEFSVSELQGEKFETWAGLTYVDMFGDCGSMYGKQDIPRKAKLNIYISEISKEQSRVVINIMYFESHLNTGFECKSTGKLEEILFNYISEIESKAQQAK
jgi:hypothetical protein